MWLLVLFSCFLFLLSQRVVEAFVNMRKKITYACVLKEREEVMETFVEARGNVVVADLQNGI